MEQAWNNPNGGVYAELSAPSGKLRILKNSIVLIRTAVDQICQITK